MLLGRNGAITAMYGLKQEDMQHLCRLCGAQLVQIAVGEYQIHFNMSPNSSGGITVGGRCEMLDPSDRVVDVWDAGQRSKEFRFFDLIGRTVEQVAIDSERSFVAAFENGFKLRFVDNSDQYESFSVGGLYV